MKRLYTEAQVKEFKKEFMSPKFRNMLKREKGTVCDQCGDNDCVQYHHIVPLESGRGNNSLNNIRCLCIDCHNASHMKNTDSDKYKKARDEGRLGRKSAKSYEEWLPWLELYFNNEIGTKEFKEKVGLAEGNKLASHKFIKRYRNENNISGYFRNTVDILAAQEQRVETRKKNHQEIQDKMYEKGI